MITVWTTFTRSRLLHDAWRLDTYLGSYETFSQNHISLDEKFSKSLFQLGLCNYTIFLVYCDVFMKNILRYVFVIKYVRARNFDSASKFPTFNILFEMAKNLIYIYIQQSKSAMHISLYCVRHIPDHSPNSNAYKNFFNAFHKNLDIMRIHKDLV